MTSAIGPGHASSRSGSSASARPAAPRRDPSGGGQTSGQTYDAERERHEQDEQDDRELPEPPLDAAPAAIDRGVAAERAGQAGAPGLEQDRGDEGDADDDLADGQERDSRVVDLRCVNGVGW